MRVNPGAEICRAFTELGFCGKGPQCEQRHVFECPDYSEHGVCRDPNCRLPHVDRAGQLRKQGRGGEFGNPKDPESTKENDLMDTEAESAEADADDISSEDLDDEYLLGAANPDTRGLSQQADYVHF